MRKTVLIASLIALAVVLSGCLELDIKPGSCPNPLNVKEKGLLPVAVLGSEEGDVTQIDPGSVRLEGVSPIRWDYEDVATPVGEGAEPCDCTEAGPDGYLDLVFQFDTQEIVAAIGSVEDGDVVELTATGTDWAGVPGEVSDCVVIKKKGKN